MTQTFKTHRRWVPGYHFVLAAIFLINLIWAGFWVLRRFSLERLVHLILAIGLVQLYLYARGFPLAVQDRLIRLEERMRLERLLPADLKPRIHEFTVGQLVGLRFASDAELSTLARRVLDEKITGREDIKKLIKDWRPDETRA